METVRHMVLQLDPRQGSLPNILSVQHAKLGQVFLGNVDLYNDVSIIFVAFLPRVVPQSGHENGFAKTAVRVPNLTIAIFGVQLKREEKIIMHFSTIFLYYILMFLFPIQSTQNSPGGKLEVGQVLQDTHSHTTNRKKQKG